MQPTGSIVPPASVYQERLPRLRAMQLDLRERRPSITSVVRRASAAAASTPRRRRYTSSWRDVGGGAALPESREQRQAGGDGPRRSARGRMRCIPSARQSVPACRPCSGRLARSRAPRRATKSVSVLKEPPGCALGPMRNWCCPGTARRQHQPVVAVGARLDRRAGDADRRSRRTHFDRLRLATTVRSESAAATSESPA